MVETGHKFHDNVSRLVNWAHWFTFFNLIMVSLISLRYIKYAGLSDSGLGIAYQFTSLIGHFSFISAMVFAVLLFPLAFMIPFQRLYRALAIIISTIAISFLIVDTQIFKLYEFHLNPLIWQFLQQPAQVEQIYSINLHYISIPIIFSIEFAISFFVWRKGRQLHALAIGKPIAIFLFVAFLLTHLTYIWADAKQYRPITQQKSLYPLSYPMTARTFLTKQGWLSEEKLQHRILRQQGNSNKSNNLDYPKQPLTYIDQDKNGNEKNILFIAVESLRADVLNEKNMPFTYSLTQKGLNYTKHFSGASNQAQGIFSLFYGLPNRYWPEITLNYIPPVFLNRLQEKNYQFGLFSSIGFVHPEFLQSSFSQLDPSNLKPESRSGTNAEITQAWSTWLASTDSSEKWFSFVYYQQKGNALSLDDNNFSLAQRTEKMARYQQQVLTIDRKIEQLITALQASKQLENSIVIITGSNGASFEKASSAQAAIYNAHVPLLVLWPGKNSRTISRMTSHVDIVPTLMETLGITNEAQQYSDGQSLFDNTARPYLLSGDLKKYVIYEQDKITQFNNDGHISSIDWQGIRLNEDEFDITLLIDVLSKLRRFNK